MLALNSFFFARYLTDDIWSDVSLKAASGELQTLLASGFLTQEADIAECRRFLQKIAENSRWKMDGNFLVDTLSTPRRKFVLHFLLAALFEPAKHLSLVVNQAVGNADPGLYIFADMLSPVYRYPDRLKRKKKTEEEKEKEKKIKN